MSDQVAIFEKADSDTLDHIRKETDAYLGAQLTVALAGNQRAMTFYGFLATASAVVGSASVTALASKPELALYAYIGLCVVVGLLVAMFLANKAAMPDIFYYVGNTPSSWLEDIKDKKSLSKSKAEALAFDADNIQNNKITLDNAAWYIRSAIRATWITVILGAASSAIVTYKYPVDSIKAITGVSCATVQKAGDFTK